jgi:hypothetical protein
MSNTFSGKLQTPSTMPPQIIQRIKNLRCPPPLQPSKMTPELSELYTNIEKQSKQIETLESQINDLEKRFAISFSANPKIQYDLQPSQHPYVDISGTVQNIQLEFHLWPARKGMKGLPGVQGDIGNIPRQNPEQGIQGYPGYYGIRGDFKK